MILVCCTRHASPTTKNHKHTYGSMLRLLCARQSFVLTQTRQQQHHYHRNHHRHTTRAPQQQQSRKDSSRGGGGLTSPTAVHVTHHPQRNNHKHTYDSILCLLCARQSFTLTQTRQQHHHHHRNHHRHITPAPQQQRSRRDSSRGGGDLTSPATVYVPDLKNKGKRQNKTYQFKMKPLSKNQKP